MTTVPPQVAAGDLAVPPPTSEILPDLEGIRAALDTALPGDDGRLLAELEWIRDLLALAKPNGPAYERRLELFRLGKTRGITLETMAAHAGVSGVQVTKSLRPPLNR